MQVQESNHQLLYGLFESISTWALDNGYKDVSGMKNLLKLSMIDACHQKHAHKPAVAAQMAVVTDLGISLRNAQRAIKALSSIRQCAGGFVKIRQIQREIAIVLNQRPCTQDEILSNVSYLIHAPYELQRRTLKAILKDMEEKTLIVAESRKHETIFKNAQAHVNLVDMEDLPSRLTALMNYLDAFNHTIGNPLFALMSSTADRARKFQNGINECLKEVGNAQEQDCQVNCSKQSTYRFFFGCTPVSQRTRVTNVEEAILEGIRIRFTEPDSPSMVRIHSYALSADCALAVFEKVCDHIGQGIASLAKLPLCEENMKFALHFGLASCEKNIE